MSLSEYNYISTYEEADRACSLLSADPNGFIPISLYSYKFTEEERRSLISKYSALTWLNFLHYIHNEEMWSQGLKVTGNLTFTLCVWFKSHGYLESFVVEAAVRDNNQMCYDYCCLNEFNPSFAALQDIVVRKLPYDIAYQIKTLIKNTDREMCELILSHTEDFIIELFLEHDDAEKFTKFIVTYEKFLMKGKVIELIQRLKDVFMAKFEDFQLLPDKDPRLQIIHLIKVHQFCGMEKSTKENVSAFAEFMRGKQNKANMNEHFVESFLDSKEYDRSNRSAKYHIQNSNFFEAYFLYFLDRPSKEKLTSDARTVIVQLCLNYKAVRCLTSYLDTLKYLNMHELLNMGLESKPEIANVLFGIIETSLRSSIVDLVPNQHLLKSAILTGNIPLFRRVRLITYPGIHDDAVCSDSIEMFDLIRSFAKIQQINFRSVRSVQMLEFLRSLGMFRDFSILEANGYIFIYEGMPRKILLWILDNYKINMLNYSTKLMQQIAIIGYNPEKRFNHSSSVNENLFILISLSAYRNAELVEKYVNDSYSDEYFFERRIHEMLTKLYSNISNSSVYKLYTRLVAACEGKYDIDVFCRSMSKRKFESDI